MPVQQWIQKPGESAMDADGDNAKTTPRTAGPQANVSTHWLNQRCGAAQDVSKDLQDGMHHILTFLKNVSGLQHLSAEAQRDVANTPDQDV